MNQGEKPKAPTIAVVAFVLACLFFIPLVPAVGAVLGIIAAVRIRRSNGRLGGANLAYGAIAVGGLCFFATLMIGGMTLAAIPAFKHFSHRARAAEVRASLESVRIGAHDYAERVRVERGRPMFPPGTTAWIPPGPCNASGCGHLDPEAFKVAPWSEIGFIEPIRPYFQYRYRSIDRENLTFEIDARADLDGDGKYQTWILRGRINGKGEAEIDPPKQETDRNVF